MNKIWIKLGMAAWLLGSLQVSQPVQAQEDELLDEETLEELLNDSTQIKNPGVYQNFSNDYGKNLRNYASGYTAYNSDTTDTDLDSYSETVWEQKKHGGLLWLAMVLLALTAVVVGAIVWMWFGQGGLR